MIYLGLAIVFAIFAFAASQRILSTTIVFFFTLAASYGGLPTLQFGFWGLPFLLLVNGVITLFVEFLLYQAGKRNARFIGPIIKTGIATLGVTLLPLFTTASPFHADSYRKLIGEVRPSTFSTDTAPIDPAHVRIIDQELAKKLGEKRLGEDTALGSQVNPGNLHIQKVNGALYWVGPLNHSGFFKWLSNRKGTPGYLMVSATDERDVRLVQEVGASPVFLKYNEGSWFGEVPSRYLYEHGYATVGLTDYTFEIDEEGRPYWVVTKFRKKIGFAGNDAVGVVVLDVGTGEIKEYGIHDAPIWMDRIQPEKFIVRQLDGWGRYVHGWWNSLLAKREMLKTTPGMSLVYGEEGNSYWYTGMSSVGEDESTVGFVLVNTRTKETRFYKQTGATETAAMKSAEGSVQEKGYTATFPILYNVGGRPTYFVTLKDTEGLVKLVAFVSVENYQMVGVGENVKSALRDYRRAVVSRGNEMAPEGPVVQRQVQGKLLRLATESKRGDTYYYLLIEGHENKSFAGSSDLSFELLLSREGDVVQVIFEEGGNPVVDLTGFDNLNLNFQKTEAQIGVELRSEEVRESVQKEANRAER